MKPCGRFTLVALVATLSLPSPAAADVTPVHTRRAEFRIPFAFDRDDDGRRGAQEVQLYVSTDRGETWRHVQSAPPAEQRFRYRAGKDGEHWFAVRTLDEDRQLHPPGKLTPGLIVVVDTAEPTARLQMSEVPGEHVEVTWQVTDENLDSDSVRIEYSSDDGQNWSPLASSATRMGQARIPVVGPGAVRVRLGVRDRAGNAGTDERLLPLKGARPVPTIHVGPGTPQVTAAPGSPTITPKADTISGRHAIRTSAADGISAAQVIRTGSRRQAATPRPAVPQTRRKPSINIPLVPNVVVPPRADGELADVYIAEPGRPVEEPEPAMVASPSPESAPVAAEPVGQASSVLPPAVGEVPVRTVARKTVTELPEGAAVADVQVAESLGLQEPEVPASVVESPQAYDAVVEPPAPGLPRIINQLTFRLDYQVDGLGPSGVSAVEVFITEDGGRKWWRYGADVDKRSPVLLRVPRDGEYGFRIAVRSGVGLGDPPPQPGDEPHTVVIVDRSPPKARLDQPAMSPDGQTLQLRWRMADPHLHSEPVRLEYSSAADGPWLPMQDWMSDAGSFDWAVPEGTPARIHVRMLVRDSAGNVGQVLYPQPVLVDVSRPRARITSVRTLPAAELP